MRSVCFVIPNLNKGGMERVVSLLANTMVNKEISISIITLTNNKIEYDIKNIINIFHINKSYKGGVYSQLKILKKLIFILRRTKPTVVVSFGTVFNPVSILAAKLTGLKIFVSDRSNPLLKYKLRDRIARTLLYPLADGLIAQTKLAKEVLMKKNYNKNIMVLPNPLIEFKNTQMSPQHKAIITVGRLVPSKNHKELIQIFKEIGFPEWKLMIVGGGPLYEELKNYVSRLNLNDQVFIIGQSNNIEEWLSQGSIFAFVSLSEGFPNSLNEAMAYPLACIAYDCPAGVIDLIKNGNNGFLIPFKNREIYKEKLTELMINNDLRLKFMTNSIKNRDLYKKEVLTLKLSTFLFKQKDHDAM